MAFEALLIVEGLRNLRFRCYAERECLHEQINDMLVGKNHLV